MGMVDDMWDRSWDPPVLQTHEQQYTTMLQVRDPKVITNMFGSRQGDDLPPNAVGDGPPFFQRKRHRGARCDSIYLCSMA